MARTPVQRPPRVVALGGGTGLPAVLQGLAAVARRTAGPGPTSRASRDRLSGIVAMTDDGGSSGRLRRQFGILPPGDVRNCLVALTPPSNRLSRVLQYRFSGGELAGHPIGNLMLAALTGVLGDFGSAVERLGTMLGVSGRVLPSCTEDVTLMAQLDNGEIVAGETAIVSRHGRIARVWLDRTPRPVADVIRALVNADLIVVGPGSLYTSLLPTLLTTGVAATIAGSTALRLYVANLMTEPGETDGYTLADHVQAITRHAGGGLFDAVLVNTMRLSGGARERYARHGAFAVDAPDAAFVEGVPIVRGAFLQEDETGRIRHAADRLADAMLALLDEHRSRHMEQSARSETKVHEGSAGGVRGAAAPVPNAATS